MWPDLNYEFIIFILGGIGCLILGQSYIFKKSVFWHKRIRPSGYLIIAISILGWFLYPLKQKHDNETQKARDTHTDSAFNDVKEALNDKESPILDVFFPWGIQNTPYPQLTNKEDSVVLHTWVRCINKGIAVVTGSKMFIFSIFKGKINERYEGKPLAKLNPGKSKNDLVYGTMSLDILNYVKISPIPGDTDTSYIYFKVIYTNKNNENEKPYDLTRVYMITMTRYKEDSFIKKGKVQMIVTIGEIANADKYNLIVDLLKREHYW